jgi:hypothetical protein
MHATVMRRIERLEDRSDAGSGKPRKVQRIVVSSLDREPSLENAECHRTLCPDGTRNLAEHSGFGPVPIRK